MKHTCGVSGADRKQVHKHTHAASVAAAETELACGKYIYIFFFCSSILRDRMQEERRTIVKQTKKKNNNNKCRDDIETGKPNGNKFQLIYRAHLTLIHLCQAFGMHLHVRPLNTHRRKNRKKK